MSGVAKLEIGKQYIFDPRINFESTITLREYYMNSELFHTYKNCIFTVRCIRRKGEDGEVTCGLTMHHSWLLPYVDFKCFKPKWVPLDKEWVRSNVN